MKYWCTILTSSGEALVEIQIMCGIFQGYALSSLFFFIASNPLSNIIERTGIWIYIVIWAGQKVHHLLYMDHIIIKLYDKKEQEIDSLINTIRIFSDDIGMKFGLEKCVRLIFESDKVAQMDGQYLT
jgi:hypothetical protein